MLKVKHKNNSNYQSGMSLIELMISMVVGLFLLAGVVTNFIGTQNADVKRDALSLMDDSANAVFNVLRPAIAHAGYPSIENIRIEKAFLTEIDGAADKTTCSGSGINNKVIWDGNINKPTKNISTKDQLTVVSLADNPCLPGRASCQNDIDKNPNALVFTDCTGGGSDTSDRRVVACSTDSENGMKNPTQAKIYNSFTLTKNVSSKKDRWFYCHGSRGGKQPIAENVEAIKYLYGVTDEDGNTYYRNAKKVEDDDQWGSVTSVQVGLLMRSANKFVLDEPSTKKKYYLLKTKVEIADADLRRLFKVYSTTIRLGNVNRRAVL